MDHTQLMDDPGWWSAFRGIGWGFVPWLVHRRTTRSRINGLLVLRELFVSFSTALVLIAGVVLILDRPNGGLGGNWSGEAGAALVGGYAVYALVATRVIVKPLDCASDVALAGSYRTTFFLRIAFSESIALVGFVAFILTGNGALYWLALVPTAVGFARAAPTAGNLDRAQEALAVAGCGRSLVTALQSPRAPDPPDA